MTTPGIQRRWKALPGEPVGDAGDAYIGYDRFGRTEAMRWIKPLDSGFDTLVNLQWGYSPSSQKTWRKDLLAPASTGQDQKFNYDALYQVTERQRGVLNVNATATGGIPAQQENFSYDETGNWKAYKQSNDGTLGIDQSRVNNRSNQITQVDGSSAGLSYDPNGNMLAVPTGEDLTGPSRRIVWDAWNRPVRVYDADDNLIAEYQYDGLGRRTTVASAGTTRHTYYDDQWRSVEERIDGTTTAERQHVWQPNNGWEMILRDRSTTNNGTMDERLYPMKDQLDPVAICDASGNVVERYAYTAFGLPTFMDVSFNPLSSSYQWNFLFHAEFQDAETGWFNYGYRYYVPELGRWPSRDPIGEEGGTNLFLYLENSTLDNQDLFGLLTPDRIQERGYCPIDIAFWFPNGKPTENNLFKAIADVSGEKIGKAKLAFEVKSASEMSSKISEWAGGKTGNCVKNLTTAGHGWSGVYLTDTATTKAGDPAPPGSGIPMVNPGGGLYLNGYVNVNPANGGLTISDLESEIKNGNIIFCEKCKIQIHACYVNPKFFDELSKATKCTVVGALGGCDVTSSVINWRSGANKNPNQTTNNKNNGLYQANPDGSHQLIGNNYKSRR